MLAGSACSALVAVWFLAHSWTGVAVMAEGPPGTEITMPAVNTGQLDVWAVRTPGQRKTDVTCKLTTTGYGFVDMYISTVSPKSNGRVLDPAAKVRSGWHKGDTIRCTGDGVETLVLGHNDGLDSLLKGLLAGFLALGSGTIGLIGFASQRYRARTMAPQPPRAA
ncbi:MAG TPA: hypothetical protein VES02_17510 [Dermatophilaceae bacterium]|nr:hypothetical protein [Dermatophilaceae bacterium]